jgi:hypothetical protein
MGYNVKIENFEDSNPASVSEFTASGWRGIADAVRDLVAIYGLPSGTEDWNEGACVQDDHDCDSDPDLCQDHAVDSIYEWIEGALEQQGQTSVSFNFTGKGREWATLTALYDGEA